MRTNSHKGRAELLFKKELRLREVAAAAYETEQQAIRQKNCAPSCAPYGPRRRQRERRTLDLR